MASIPKSRGAVNAFGPIVRGKRNTKSGRGVVLVIVIILSKIDYHGNPVCRWHGHSGTSS